VSWYTVTLDNPDHSSRVAQAIDAISANSDHETKTQTESAFQQAFVKQFADIGMIVTSIMGAVFFTLLLLTGNTMAQAVRERVPELATLKTLGFKDSTVLTLVMVESVLLIGLGGLIGMGLAALILPVISPKSIGMLPPHVPTPTWLMGLGLIVVIGIIVGLLPALRAKRLKIVDALAGR
ncbi:ABC transporter permease, partial [Escherichia coli]